MNLETLCTQTRVLVHSVGQLIIEGRKSFNRRPGEVKGLHNYVTHIAN